MMKMFRALLVAQDCDTLPLLPIVDLRDELYARDFSNAFLNTCGNYSWNFDQILPDLQDTTFLRRQAGSIPTEFARSAELDRIHEEGQADAAALLTKLAEFLWAYTNRWRNRPDFVQPQPLERTVALDGYAFVSGRIMPAGAGVISTEEQRSFLMGQIRECRFSGLTTLEHHEKNARETFIEGRWDTSVGEARKFLQGLLDEIARETSANRPDLSNPPGGTKNVIRFLKDCGFLNEDETQAMDAAWTFLCSGSHPGIGPELEARIGLSLATEFALVLAIKFLNWRENRYRGFSG